MCDTLLEGQRKQYLAKKKILLVLAVALGFLIISAGGDVVVALGTF